jgi:hypothetical protein
MKKITLFLLIVTISSCQDDSGQSTPENQAMFPENIVDLAIKTKDKNVIELPMMYDSLIRVLPEGETTKLGEILVKKGFTQIEAKQGNWGNRGPRFVHRSFRKDDCICNVSKMYYTTTNDKLFEIHESIHCFEAKK